MFTATYMYVYTCTGFVVDTLLVYRQPPNTWMKIGKDDTSKDENAQVHVYIIYELRLLSAVSCQIDCYHYLDVKISSQLESYIFSEGADE